MRWFHVEPSGPPVPSSLVLKYTIAGEIINNRGLASIAGDLYASSADRLVKIESDFSGHSLTSQNTWQKPNRGINFAELLSVNDKIYYTTTRFSGLAPYSANVIIIDYDGTNWTFLYSGGSSTNGVQHLQYNGTYFYFDIFGRVFKRDGSFAAVSDVAVTTNPTQPGCESYGLDGAYYVNRESSGNHARSILPAAFTSLSYFESGLVRFAPYTNGVLAVKDNGEIWALDATGKTLKGTSFAVSSSIRSSLHYDSLTDGYFFSLGRSVSPLSTKVYFWKEGYAAAVELGTISGNANWWQGFHRTSNGLYMLHALGTAAIGPSEIYEIV